MSGEDSGRDSLERRLNALADSDIYPFHMPGHKRNPEFAREYSAVYRMDITEIEGFDNLHHPQGILRESMENAARSVRADRTWFLVNGSTCGIQAALGAVAKPGEQVLLARNFHRSAGQMLTLRDFRPVFVLPEEAAGGCVCGSVDPEKIRRALREYPAVRAVFLTSPTYEGIVSDVRAIAEAAHEKDIPLIVDEAHGAHFSWENGGYFPESALDLGADLVIQSLHKTLPALTQTAVLHLRGDRVSPEEIFRQLRIFETSSPSYVLMSSIDRCFCYMDSGGKERLKRFGARMERFYAELGGRLNTLQVPGRINRRKECFDRDLSKVVIFGGGKITGTALADILRRTWHLEPEMACRDYVICMTSLMDTENGLERLFRAILAIDGQLTGENEKAGLMGVQRAFRALPRAAVPPEEAFDGPWENVALAEAAGRTAADFVTVYPPGVPMLIPGEEISPELVEIIREDLKLGLEVDGVGEGAGRVLRCRRE
jgi:arginine decarboxylase